MSDARQSPIPQDRVDENVDQRERARTSKHEKRMEDRYLEEQGVDERPGTNPQKRPASRTIRPARQTAATEADPK